MTADRLTRAAQGADIIVHAAAMKQVPACEYNPMEAVATNVLGAQNIVDSAIDAGVEQVVALSTDKAVNPVNLYGATKLCEEKIIVQGNAYAAQSNTRLSCVRYGNVVGSRGSVVPVFRQQLAETGRLTITDERMTRFWITLTEAVDLVLFALEHADGGETFIPKIPSMRIIDLAEALAPGIPTDVIGIRPGEKLHEVLLTSDESPPHGRRRRPVRGAARAPVVDRLAPVDGWHAAGRRLQLRQRHQRLVADRSGAAGAASRDPLRAPVDRRRRRRRRRRGAPSDLLTTGPAVERSRHALCEVTGARFAVAVANGTAALHAACAAAGSRPGPDRLPRRRSPSPPAQPASPTWAARRPSSTSTPPPGTSTWPGCLRAWMVWWPSTTPGCRSTSRSSRTDPGW